MQQQYGDGSCGETGSTAVDPRAGALYQQVLAETLRKDVQRDDILDAMVGCLTATASGTRQMSWLVGDPAQDEVGPPMEMVYREPAQA